MQSIKNIIILLLMIQTVSCQQTDLKNENLFSIVNEKISYNGSEVFLGMQIEKFVDIVDSDYRIATYSVEGKIAKTWSWKDGGEAYMDDDDKIKYFDLKKNLNNGPLDKKFNNIEEVVKLVGKYDSFTIDKFEGGVVSKFYVFDHLGFNVAINEKDNTVSQINIFPLSFSKTTLEPKMLPPTVYSKKVNYISTEDKTDVENFKIMFDRQPKKEFKGKFSYNGNTADFSKIGYTDWKKMVSDLKIASSTYDPPGDSEGWSREIREDFDKCMININRYNNTVESYDSPSAEAVGKIDAVKSIEIFRFTDEDRK